jgi:peptide/nickel transport system substrate-binding protein
MMATRTTRTARTSSTRRAFGRTAFGLGPLALLTAHAAARLPLVHARGEGGTFVFGRSGDSVRLDPATVADLESFRVTDQLFDTLVQFDGSSTDLRPALARSWDISPDGLTYTFRLREGVRFHDGTALDAAAVKWNFDRWGDAENRWHAEADEEGAAFEYYEDVTGFGEAIERVEAPDAATVRITLGAPQGPFLLNLALPAFGIISPSSAAAGFDALSRAPVGSGAFRFVEWVPGDRIVLDRFEGYWGEVSRVDRVVVRTIPDNAARYLALRAASIDMMEGANPDDVASARRDRSLSVQLRPSMDIAYINMNLTQKPFDSEKVRHAVGAAINRSQIVEALYGGTGKVASQLVPESLLGWNPDVKGPQYDPERAKRLLAEAGYPTGFATDFWYMPVSRPYYPNPQAIAEAIAADLGKVGIRVTLKTEDWATYLEDRNALKFPIWMLGWIGDNGDPDNFLYTFFGNLRNDNSWDNAAVRALLRQAQQSVDTSEREAIYREVNRVVEAEAPRIPVAYSTPALLARAYVKGYLPHPTATEYYNAVWLDR